MTVIICDICKQPIATVDRKTVHAPITGDRLKSPMPKAGVPELIPDGVAWVNMRCPRCHTRPFLNDHTLTTDQFEKIELKKKRGPKRGRKPGK